MSDPKKSKRPRRRAATQWPAGAVMPTCPAGHDTLFYRDCPVCRCGHLRARQEARQEAFRAAREDAR